LVEAGLVVEVPVVELEGVACEFGVVSVPLGVVVAPLEVDPGVMVDPVELLPLVPVVEVPLFEDCGTPLEPAGTQFALAVLEVPGVELVVVEVEPVVELLLGEVLLLELGIELELLGDVLLVEDELGDVLLLELGVVVLVEELGVEVVLLVDPVALALVLGTMPAGQLLVEEAPGVVALGLVVVEVPLCDDDGIVLVPDCEAAGAVLEVEGVVDVVVLVVDDVCAATHVPAVRITTNVNFFMFSVLVYRVALFAMPVFRAGCAAADQKKRAGFRQPTFELLLWLTCVPCDGTMRPSPWTPTQEASTTATQTQSVAAFPFSRWCRCWRQRSGRCCWLQPRLDRRCFHWFPLRRSIDRCCWEECSMESRFGRCCCLEVLHSGRLCSECCCYWLTSLCCCFLPAPLLPRTKVPGSP